MRGKAESQPQFLALFSVEGRPSTPPERLPGPNFLIALHTVRSERQFCEQLRHNLLVRRGKLEEKSRSGIFWGIQ